MFNAESIAELRRHFHDAKDRAKRIDGTLDCILGLLAEYEAGVSDVASGVFLERLRSLSAELDRLFTTG